MNTFIKYFSIITVLILLVEIVPNNSRSDVVISNSYPVNVSSISPNLYMETGPGYGKPPSYPPTNSFKYFYVEGITRTSVEISSGSTIYINSTGSSQKISCVLEIINNTNVKIPINIYFNTSINNQLPNGLNIYNSTKTHGNIQYYPIEPKIPIHLTQTSEPFYISFSLTSTSQTFFELYLIFVINGVIITYSFPVYLNE